MDDEKAFISPTFREKKAPFVVFSGGALALSLASVRLKSIREREGEKKKHIKIAGELGEMLPGFLDRTNYSNLY